MLYLNYCIRYITFRSTILAFLSGVIDTEFDPERESVGDGVGGSFRLRLTVADVASFEFIFVTKSKVDLGKKK